MSESTLRFSVVTPSYNQGEFIRWTIDSVLRQNYSNIEYLVIDGASTDETVGILKSYSDPRLGWLSEPDAGQTDAINKGLRKASGDILAYLNSDDTYLPGTLAFVADFFVRNPDVDVLYGHCVSLDASNQQIYPSMPASPFNLQDALKKRWHIWQPAVFWRRSVTETIGLFDDSLYFAMDTDYWMRMLAAGYIPQLVDRELAGFRFHDESKTLSQSEYLIKDLQRVFKKFYATPGLPDVIRQMQPLTEAYLAYYNADVYWKLEKRAAARPYLRHILKHSAPLRLKVMATARLLDAYVNTSLHRLLANVYHLAARKPRAEDVYMGPKHYISSMTDDGDEKQRS